MPRNIAGPPVAGEDCFGCGAFIQELELRIEQCSVLVLAPRRWGKTSVLRELRNRAPATRHYFDLYQLDRTSDFLAEIAATTAGPVSRVKQYVGNLLGGSPDRLKEIRIAELAIELRERLAQNSNWQDEATRLFAGFPPGHLFILDEFPMMAKAILDRDAAEGAALLHWLRSQRQRDDGPRFILAGSTSLVELCRQEGLSHTINDLELLRLPRFDADAARALLHGLFATEGVAIDDASLDVISELVGPEVPFFLQIMTRTILAEVRETGAAISPLLVRSLYQNVLLGADNRAYLDDFRGRLDRYYLGEERRVALIVLGALSRQRDGLNRRALQNRTVAQGADDALLDPVMALLEGDFYISRGPQGQYRFLNRYLADWWQRFHA